MIELKIMNKIKDNFPERVLKVSIAGLVRSEGDDSLNVIINDYRDEACGRAVADLLFNYFRNKAFIDYLIEKFTGTGKKNSKSTPAKFRRIMAIVLTQSLFQSGIDSHIAVDVAVEYAKKRYGRTISGFINAVLRRCLASDIKKLKIEAPESVRLNIPPQVLSRWKGVFTDEKIAELADVFSEKAPLLFRLVEKISESELKNTGCIKIKMPMWAEDYCFYEAGNSRLLFEKEWLDKGWIYIQDLSTLSPCLFYQSGESDLVYDLCSAPGGKSVLIYERMKSGMLIASDISLKRQHRTIENLEKNQKGKLFFAIVASALLPPLKEKSADCVLLDVPCTNTGVVRRRPDVLWNFSIKKLKELTAIQANILNEVAILIKPGGSLIYSTCSMENEENRERIDEFLSNHPEFSLKDERRLLPSKKHDGGYAVLLRKCCNPIIL